MRNFLKNAVIVLSELLTVFCTRSVMRRVVIQTDGTDLQLEPQPRDLSPLEGSPRLVEMYRRLERLEFEAKAREGVSAKSP